jgi:SNF2 family DNA or RNA helicase
LEAEDLERLWKLTDNENTTDDETRDILKMLQQGLAMAQASSSANNEGQGQSGTAPPQLAPVPAEVDEMVENAVRAGPAFRFRKYLKSLRETGRWEVLNMRCCCHSCGELPRQPHITSCMHVYCYECLQAMAYAAAQQENIKTKCIECGTEYENAEPCRGFEEAGREDGTPASARSAVRKRKKSNDDEEDADWFQVSGEILRSAKTKAATVQIEEWLADDPKAKIIVFTQFIGMIKVMSRICSEKDWGHQLFHGSMSFESRDNAITAFSNEPDTKILLTSLKAGGGKSPALLHSL